MDKNEQKAIEDLFNQVDAFITKAWQTVVSGPELNDISERVRDNVNTYSTIIHDLFVENAPSVAQPKRAPSPPPSAYRSILDCINSRPLISSAVVASVTGATIYMYLYPPSWLSKYSLFKPAYPRPLPLTPRPKMASDGSGARLEAVLILGAEKGSFAREVALDLEKRGFVVLATVANKDDVGALEIESRGFIRAIAFDPADPETIPAFLRTVSTTLSLQFPRHSPGDPFRPAHLVPCLSAVINALPLENPDTERTYLPLESENLSSITNIVTSRVVSSIGVIQRCLPLLRQSREAPGLVLTLVRSSTSRVSLPFAAVDSASDAALISAMESLRREIKLSEKTSGKVRVVNLDIGFYQSAEALDHTQRSSAQTVSPSALLANLPAHQREIYGAAILRRSLHSVKKHSRLSRRRSDVANLTSKIARIVLSNRQPTRRGIGAGSWTYYLASLMPSIVVDNFFVFQDTMAWMISQLQGTCAAGNTCGKSSKSLPTPLKDAAESKSMSSNAEPPLSGYVRVKPSSVSESDFTSSEPEDVGLDSSTPDLSQVPLTENPEKNE